MALGERLGQMRFLIRGRGGQLTDAVDTVFESCGLRVLRSPPQAPRANAICERLVGTLCRELLDHILIVNEAHLGTVLAEYVTHYNVGRPHQRIAQRCPEDNPDHATATVIDLSAARVRDLTSQPRPEPVCSHERQCAVRRCRTAALVGWEGESMRRVSAFGLAWLVTLAAVVAVPCEGWAVSVPPTAGSVVSSISAPATARAASTYAFSFTMRQTSSYTMLADGALVTIWLPSNLGAYVATRNALQWRNPATGAWQSPTRVDDSTGDYVFDLGYTPSWVRVAPHGSVTYDFRLSLASSLPAGTYHLFPHAPTYELDDSAGASVNAQLDTPDVMTTFTLGEGSSTSGGTQHSGSGTGGGQPTAAATTAAPATSVRPSPTATASPSVSTLAVATSGAVTPSPGRTLLDPVPSAATRSRSTPMVFWPVALVVLGVPMGFVVLRRRRAHGVAGAGNGDSDQEQ